MEHFVLRTKALIIDAVIVTLFSMLLDNILYIILSILNNQILLAYYPTIVLIVVTMLYFTIFEAKTNKTIGKKVTNLYVSDEEGYMSYRKAFIRNLTKIYWVPLVFDIIIGKLLNYPSRLFDKLAGTDVYSDIELEQVEE
ncbi:MAG TPA: RDD family protein [Methanosphaera sp.]|nr:RDD family protein [Methanosphaera sp.]HII08058.1 RDD family protein [Methanosphaera sp.]HIJ16113.1 RDD family protein [Methanosphaera sp.]